MNDTLGALFAVLVLWVIVRIIGSRGTSVSPGAIDAVHSMFPHVSKTAIHYDLLQTGSAEATCDKILRDGTLPEPPAGFRLPEIPGTHTTPVAAQAHVASAGLGAGSVAGTPAPAGLAVPNTPAQSTTTATASPNTVSPTASLIAKYRLEERLQDEITDDVEITNKGKERVGRVDPQAWAAQASDREAELRERKARMVLAARRRLMEKSSEQ
ncbi:hypothetical protein MCUN1_002029 [Malassezia cuniculi]|uniref:CUE domain-containing protein n=1 Tax=Malassezia cuniculi TaxID=948313 RepID=A0AAF0EVA7_9BASI|nr:hypothetical protein MCUN1_002029 [Malassezia cuniculi]